MCSTTELTVQLPPREPHGHKGTFGTVMVVGGRADDQRVMVGGPALAALGALRAGCGLAILAVPTPIMAAALVIAPSATGVALPVNERGELCASDAAQIIDRHLRSCRCVALGPGLGNSVPAQQVVLRLASQTDVPLVIDADGLNALAAMREFHRDFRASAVLTPHPGEFRRIAESLGVAHDPTDERARPAAAAALAQRLGCVVVLKGARTVISDGHTTCVNHTGNAALATAGTGDVLTGVIAGLIAQFFAPATSGVLSPLTADLSSASTSSSTSTSRAPRASRAAASEGVGVSPSRRAGAPRRESLALLDCARLGVHLHGLAADAWAAQHGTAGMLAHELASEIPRILARLRLA